ncbi:MAG TPA: hypothetical protein PLD10_04805 [Rhodopila sp.]|nr:hypothetical protein [Rhodopila sp.]
MSAFPNIAAAFLEEILIFLAPMFMNGAAGDASAARHAALCALAAYDPRTEQELRLAAEITSLGFSMLEALAQSANPDLSLSAVLRLRGNANALHRSAHQCQRVLDRLRKQRPDGAAHEQPHTPGVPAAQSAEKPAIAAPCRPTAPDPGYVIELSRQQRRELERKQAKILRQEAERMRRDHRTKLRNGPQGVNPASLAAA